MRSDGGPAFPTEHFDNVREAPIGHHGMSLRDYYAGIALQAFYSGQAEEDWTEDVKRAWKMADAMLREREK